MQLVADILIGLLVLFSLRRLLWISTSWLRRRDQPETSHRPDVLVVVAFRNEQAALPCLLSSLDALDYDRARLSICLVDDASKDAGAGIAAEWAGIRPHVRLMVLDTNMGKAEALNRAIASTVGSPDVIAVYDADQRPQPESLSRLVEPFAESNVAAVAGYRRPVLRRVNAITAYACLEAWTYQLINLAAKDVLGLDPPTMGGNCAYRRTALQRVGGFPSGAFSEDIEVSLALAGSGGKTRFIRAAVADHAVADSFHDFLNQRIRWSRGLLASRRQVHSLEAAFVVTGYLDRVILLLVAACVVSGDVSPWWITAYAGPALAAVITAVMKARPDARLAGMVLATFPVMFAVDIAISVWAMLRGIAGRQVQWKADADATATLLM